MATLYKNLKQNFLNIVPVFLLYFFSITELDANFAGYFKIISFNLQLIIIYYWTLRYPHILGNVHIFIAGVINDVVMGLPMGASALSYLIVAFVASYIRNITVKHTLFTDWITFLIAIFFSNFVFIFLIYKFTNFNLTYLDLFYNSLFTFLSYPFLWFIFNLYASITNLKIND